MNNRLRDYICNRNMDKIRNTFKKYFSASGLELPDDISPYGELSSKDGWHLIYSLAEDCDMNPLLKFEASHRMTNTRYISIDSSGELDGLDIDETDSSAIRLSGLGDNADYFCKNPREHDKGYTFFWENSSPFSQWHKSDFRALGIGFNSAEQYMMFQKAILFNDYETAEKILDTRNVRTQKELGRQVKGFGNGLWTVNCRRIVYEANKYKFSQNRQLLDELLATRGTTLVEASPYDTIWGIGLTKDDERATDRSKWKGKNWLGHILTLLRDDFENVFSGSVAPNLAPFIRAENFHYLCARFNNIDEKWQAKRLKELYWCR